MLWLAAGADEAVMRIEVDVHSQHGSVRTDLAQQTMLDQRKLPGEVAELSMVQAHTDYTRMTIIRHKIFLCTEIDVRATRAAANVLFITSSPTQLSKVNSPLVSK